MSRQALLIYSVVIQSLIPTSRDYHGSPSATLPDPITKSYERISKVFPDRDEWRIMARACLRHYHFLTAGPHGRSDGLNEVLPKNANTLDIAFRHAINEWHLAEIVDTEGLQKFNQNTQQLPMPDWSLHPRLLEPPAARGGAIYACYARGATGPRATERWG